jgi:hypothetical protein
MPAKFAQKDAAAVAAVAEDCLPSIQSVFSIRPSYDGLFQFDTMPRMRNRSAIVAATVLLLLIATSCTMWKNPPKGWKGATGGEQLERLFWDDIKAKNWADLSMHLEPMFVSIAVDARRDRDASLERWKQYQVQSVSVTEVQVQTAGTDFIVTAKVTLTGSAAGKPLPSQPVTTMTVWQQVSKGWVAVAHSDPLP